MQTAGVGQLVRDGGVLAYDVQGRGGPDLVFVHGIACNRRFWDAQVRHFASDHRVVVVDLRGHGESDAPRQHYTMGLFADDLAWTCAQLEIHRPVVIGHSLGGLIALEFAATYPDLLRAAVMIDSVLLPPGDRASAVGQIVSGLSSPRAEQSLRDYFATFFGPHDNPERKAWILDQAVRTQPHVTRSVWEESLLSWDDADALRRCRGSLLYLDAGTPNADLARALELCPQMMIGRTIGSGHFSPMEVPEQVNPMLERFLAVAAT